MLKGRGCKRVHYSKKHRFIYICTPRTSSLSTSAWLTYYYGAVELGDYHSAEVPPAIASCFIFTTVRNPYTRAQSIFSWVMQQHRDMYDDLPSMTFDQFLLWLVTKLPGYKHPNAVMFQSQSMFLGDTRLDRVCHFEKVPRVYRTLPFVRRVTLSHYNKGRRKKPELTSERKALIQEWAGEDFTRFGYDL